MVGKSTRAAQSTRANLIAIWRCHGNHLTLLTCQVVSEGQPYTAGTESNRSAELPQSRVGNAGGEPECTIQSVLFEKSH